ncbi:hypothetical protein C0W35_11320 [Photobacterium kishitanii]|uniref:hypothetical protein n=1 Tax=Photobacterium kishitanii TaxID=318456 RepID=UPI000D15CD07|nr:hypothetical protein [Photobacterium kishitanii]PSU93788.1 hypothetical protein C0W35_11320 [Photobacterium kishitanii]
MILIWTKFGFLVPLLTLIGILIGLTISPTNNGIGLLVAAVLIWFSGKKLNKPSGEVYINEKTNERVTIDRKSTFFFLPMQYYAIPALLLGLLLVFH